MISQEEEEKGGGNIQTTKRRSLLITKWESEEEEMKKQKGLSSSSLYLSRQSDQGKKGQIDSFPPQKNSAPKIPFYSSFACHIPPPPQECVCSCTWIKNTFLYKWNVVLLYQPSTLTLTPPHPLFWNHTLLGFFSWNRTLSGLRSPITPSPALFTIFSCIFYLSLFSYGGCKCVKSENGFFFLRISTYHLWREKDPHTPSSKNQEEQTTIPKKSVDFTNQPKPK